MPILSYANRAMMRRDEGGGKLKRREFIQLAGSFAGSVGMLAAGQTRHGSIALIVDPADVVAGAGPARWAATELEHALGAAGVAVHRYERLSQAKASDLCIVAAGSQSRLAAGILKQYAETLKPRSESLLQAPAGTPEQGILELDKSGDKSPLSKGILELDKSGDKSPLSKGILELDKSGDRSPLSKGILELDKSGDKSPHSKGRAGTGLAEGSEALGLVPGNLQGRKVLLACGTDPRGLVYALLELADRIQYGGDPLSALELRAPVIERPANSIRSVMRL